MKNIHDTRIREIIPLISPAELYKQIPVPEELQKEILQRRSAIVDIITRKDTRLLGIVGPCSLHDEQAAYEYARRLKTLADAVSDRIYIVMRTYFEKPRTTVGWRGLILDPMMDGSYQIAEGLTLARRILLEINTIGLPVGCEMLDPIVPQYIDELVSWAAIGARTTESQTHRNLAGGLSVPVGFKNSTSGNPGHALNAIRSAASPASFIGIDKDGNSAILRTTGNEHGHLILRGGSNGPNYYDEDVESVAEQMRKEGIIPSIIIDCSHANSSKKFQRQSRVLRSVIDQVVDGNPDIAGFMLESNLCEGNQEIVEGHSDELTYGVSVTDACIGWEETERIIMKAYEDLSALYDEEV